MKESVWIVGVFFFLLFVALFLGDGKQAVIEAYGAAVVVVCWALYIYKKKSDKRRSFPTHFLLPWVAVGVVALVSTLFSASIGFSISWLGRCASGYLIYRLFFEIADDEKTRVYGSSIMFLVLGAGLLFVASATFSWFRELLPSMNLLDVRHGHSHLAELLVFVFPLVFHFVTTTHAARALRISVFVLFIGFLFFTFARGAWFIVALFFIYRVFGMKKHLRLQHFLYVCLAFVCIGTALYYWKPSIIRPQTIGSRFEYWRQGLDAFKQRPLLGYGPGTFSLASLRYQKSSGTSSWFAHSLPIQTIAEQGVFGLVVFGWLLLLQVQTLRRLKSPSPLLWSVVLILFYSLFEFVLDYFLVWLLFWSSCGLLAGISSQEHSYKKRMAWAVAAPLLFIVVYYATSVLGTTFVLFGKYNSAFYVAPYDSTYALLYIEKVGQKFRIDDERWLLLFHKKNPAIFFVLATVYEKKGEFEQALRYYRFSVETNSTNVEYQRRLARVYFEHGDPGAIENYIRQTCRYMTKTRTEYCAIRIEPSESKKTFESIGSYINILSESDFRLAYQKVLYFSGLKLLASDPALTKKLWSVARVIVPTWGYYHVELAALEYYILGDTQSAQNALVFCQNYPFVQSWCTDLYFNLRRLPGVGTQEQFIRAIPKIL